MNLDQYVSVFDVLLIAILLFGIALTLVFSVFLFSLSLNRHLTQRKVWQDRINSYILTIIELGELQEDQEISSLIKIRDFRNLFVESLVRTERRFTGEVASLIVGLFCLYKLEPYSVRKLRSTKFYRIARGINELRAMRVESAIDLIKSKLNHRSPEVYQEAQYAMVYLQGFSGLAFLSGLQTPLSNWQQIRLLHSVTAIPSDASVLLSLWLSSQNPTVVVFSLKLVYKFQLFYHLSSVFRLLKHPDLHVRLQAVRVLDVLDSGRASQELVTQFLDQPVKVQIAMVKMIQILRDKSQKQALLSWVGSDLPISVRLQAAEALNSWDFDEDLRQLAAAHSDDEVHSIVKHALHSRL